MAEGARVQSLDSMKDFRIYLTKFQESASLALGDADSDVNRTLRWVEGEQQSFWTQQIRKRQEALAKAEEALRFKRLYKDASGSQQSAVEEQKAVTLAKRNLEEAVQKLNACKQWVRRLQKEITLYRGGVARFANAVAASIPHAIGQLGDTLVQLEKYIGLAPASLSGAGGEVSSSAGALQGGAGSMARPAEAAAAAPPAQIDPARLRASVPAAETLAAAEAAPEGPVNLAAGALSPQQQAIVHGMEAGSAAVEDKATIAIAAGAGVAANIFLLRGQPSGENSSGWVVASVEGSGASDYNTATAADLRLGRPDLGELLKLPVGTLVVVSSLGLMAIFDASNNDIFAPAQAKFAAPPPPEAGDAAGAAAAGGAVSSQQQVGSAT